MSHDRQPNESRTDEAGLPWDDIDRYLAGAAEVHETERIRRTLSGYPRAEQTIQRFLDLLDADTPTAEEKASLHHALRVARRASGYSALTVSVGTTSSPAPSARNTPHTHRRGWVRNAGMAVAACAAFALVTLQFWPRNDVIAGHAYVTSRGELGLLRLTDGSMVTIGPASRVAYTHTFGSADRRIEMDGEAYFTVTPDADVPFVVVTARAETQVLGTEFFVNARGDDSVAQVVVTSGKVAFRSRGAAQGSGTTLIPGDLARINDQGLTTVTRGVALGTYTVRKHGRLDFTHVEAVAAIREIEARYDITIDANQLDLTGATVSMALDSESPDQAMAVLADVLGVSWHRTNSIVILSPKPRPSR